MFQAYTVRAGSVSDGASRSSLTLPARMSLPARKSPRAAMSLVEMMVVMAIIAVLASLAFVLFKPSVEGRMRHNSESTIQTIKAALDKHWAHVKDEANRDPIPAAVLSWAG